MAVDTLECDLNRSRKLPGSDISATHPGELGRQGSTVSACLSIARSIADTVGGVDQSER
jgi:hypothetical protein